MGEFSAKWVADELVVNGSRPLPIAFLKGCKDKLSIDKFKHTNKSILMFGAISTLEKIDQMDNVEVHVGNRHYVISEIDFKNGLLRKKHTDGIGHLRILLDPFKCKFKLFIRDPELSEIIAENLSVQLIINSNSTVVFDETIIIDFL